jgi:CHAT domain-containing protein
MQTFYRNLAQINGRSKITKAEALRQAQLEILSGGSSINPIKPGIRGDVVALDVEHESHEISKCGYSHPYYWAPFILIGNFL